MSFSCLGFGAFINWCRVNPAQLYSFLRLPPVTDRLFIQQAAPHTAIVAVFLFCTCAGMGEIQELADRLCASRRFRANSSWVIPLHSTVSPRWG